MATDLGLKKLSRLIICHCKLKIENCKLTNRIQEFTIENSTKMTGHSEPGVAIELAKVAFSQASPEKTVGLLLASGD